MKNKFFIKYFVLLIITIIFVKNVNATVGGQTVVYDLRYDTNTNSVYYTENSESGRGCPPILKSISLDTNAEKTIFGCDDMSRDQANKIYNFTSKFNTLIPISLGKNNLSVSIDKLDTVTMKYGQYSEISHVNFIANIFQSNIKKMAIPFTGCSVEQPLTIAGYRIDRILDKVVLIFSRKSNCFEGGYIGEFVKIVSGINLTDKSYYNSYKTANPLFPEENNLVVYFSQENVIPQKESGNITQPQQSNENQDISNNQQNRELSKSIDYTNWIVIPLAFVILAVGILLGRLGHKKDEKS